MELDLKRLEALMALMQTLGIAELDYRKGAEHLRLVRGIPAPFPPSTTASPSTQPVTVSAATVSEPAASTTETIEAPMHGQFYTSPAPDAPPFVRVGDTVAEGQPLYILEVMKTLSRVEAEYSCRIIDILVRNGQSLEPGMPLFHVERIHA